MTLIRNEIEYTVTNEFQDKYEAVSEDNQLALIPKSMVRDNYKGEMGYYFTKESVQAYWKAKYEALNQ